jgi:uncharacterized membrane protein YidH (DUF202 family)
VSQSNVVVVIITIVPCPVSHVDRCDRSIVIRIVTVVVIQAGSPRYGAVALVTLRTSLYSCRALPIILSIVLILVLVAVFDMQNGRPQLYA